jgi:hypothetical protein
MNTNPSIRFDLEEYRRYAQSRDVEVTQPGVKKPTVVLYDSCSEEEDEDSIPIRWVLYPEN